MPKRDDIVDFLDDVLDIRGVSDHSMNGLQVQGADEVTRVGLATDAALSTYKKAVDAGCQMLVVHHGFIWGGINYITGRNFNHVHYLITNELNLYAAHLPLDLHPDLGNNILLAQEASLIGVEPFGSYHGINIGIKGALENPLSVDAFAALWAARLGCEPRVLPFGPDEIRTVGIVSGGGSSALEEAIQSGLDCLVTGEGPHERYHQAKEGQIHLIYIGHYLSETIGVKAVGRELEEEFKGLEAVFIDEPTGF